MVWQQPAPSVHGTTPQSTMSLDPGQAASQTGHAWQLDLWAQPTAWGSQHCPGLQPPVYVSSRQPGCDESLTQERQALRARN